jgi:hypothetical protein
MGMEIPLEQLDRKKVAVEVPFPDGVRVLRGVGVLCRDPVLEDCLRIVVDDPAAGQLEILLRTNAWGGPIAVDDRYDCDFRIRLDPNRQTH